MVCVDATQLSPIGRHAKKPSRFEKHHNPCHSLLHRLPVPSGHQHLPARRPGYFQGVASCRGPGFACPGRLSGGHGVAHAALGQPG